MEWVARTCCYCCFTYIVQEIFAYQRLFILLGVRSLANASRARQFNPLNPLGWGGYRFLKQIWQPWSVVRGRSCVVVRGRAWSCMAVRGRAWSVVRAWSVIRGRAWSVVRGRARSVVRGRAVLPASRPARQPALPCCPLRGQHCRDTNEGRKERTNEQHIITP